MSALRSLLKMLKLISIKYIATHCNKHRPAWVMHCITCYQLMDGSKSINIDPSNAERDWGIWIIHDLKWSLQCSKAASKAMKALGMIRTFVSLSKDGFHILYNTYVRPHLEYCSQAWSPYYKKDISCLEKVQRRATKLVRSLKNRPYHDRLKQLNLYSLEYRRLRGTLIETYKIMTNK